MAKADELLEQINENTAKALRYSRMRFLATWLALGPARDPHLHRRCSASGRTRRPTSSRRRRSRWSPTPTRRRRARAPRTSPPTCAGSRASPGCPGENGTDGTAGAAVELTGSSGARAGRRVTPGAAGPGGAMGPAGPAGPLGGIGPAGAAGAQGATGRERHRGRAGAEGREGRRGRARRAGRAGASGTAGPAGPARVQHHHGRGRPVSQRPETRRRRRWRPARPGRARIGRRVRDRPVGPGADRHRLLPGRQHGLERDGRGALLPGRDELAGARRSRSASRELLRLPAEVDHRGHRGRRHRVRAAARATRAR